MKIISPPHTYKSKDLIECKCSYIGCNLNSLNTEKYIKK